MNSNDSATAEGVAIRAQALLSRVLATPSSVRRAVITVARDCSASAMLAGCIAIVVGYSGPAVVVLTAAAAGQLSPAQSTSWIWAMSVAAGILSLVLSLWTRVPVLMAWSTPGAALLVTSLARYPYPDVIGAYLVVAAATVLVGARGWLGLIIRRVPDGLVSAMLAGILFSFGTGAFTALADRPLVPAAVLVAFLVGRRMNERLAVPMALVVGVIVAVAGGQVEQGGGGSTLALAEPVWTAPSFSVAAVVGIGIPLFVVTMTAQNAAGIGVLTAHGYSTDDRKLITGAGVCSLLTAPFGSHALNLSAITAAIAAGPDAHPDPDRRYIAAVTSGLLYLVVGSFGASLIAVFAALPPELVASVAGVALLSALAGALQASLASARHREPAVITFLTTASGITLLGIGAAFWGVVFGLITDRVMQWGKPAAGPSPEPG